MSALKFYGGRPVDYPALTLKGVAEPLGLRMGVATEDAFISFAGYRNAVVTPHFDHIKPKSLMKRRLLEPTTKGVYDFSRVEALYPYLDSLGFGPNARRMDLHGHALSWYDGNPAWLQAILDAAAPGTLPLSLLTDYVTDVVTRFATGRMLAWDCANECFIPTQDAAATRPCAEFAQWEYRYIETPFDICRSIDPNAKRVLNQNFLVSDNNGNRRLREYMLKYLVTGFGGTQGDGKRPGFNANGDPILGAMERDVGIQVFAMQAHMEPYRFVLDAPEWIAFVRALVAAGYEVSLSEMTFETPQTFGGYSLADKERLRSAADTAIELFRSLLTAAAPGTATKLLCFWGGTTRFTDTPGGLAEPFGWVPATSSYPRLPVVDATIEVLREFV